MEGNIERRNNSVNESSAESREQLLSPEVVERIMGKVRDINKEGTAFSFVINYWEKGAADLNKLKSIFESGLMGTHHSQEGISRSGFGNPIDKRTYIQTLKQRKGPDVFFNIVGRMGENRDYHTPTIAGAWAYWRPQKESMAIIFDIAKFKEVSVRSTGDLKPRTFRRYFGFIGRSTWRKNEHGEFVRDEKGMLIEDPSAFKELDLEPDEIRSQASMEYGFFLSPRVPPRLFNGVVFSMSRKLSPEEYEDRIRRILNRKLGRYNKEDVDPRAKGYEDLKEEILRELGYSEKDFDIDRDQIGSREEEVRRSELLTHVYETRADALARRAKEIAQIMIETDLQKPERLVPIYDLYGNLWWPKQMSHEDIKRYTEDQGRENDTPDF